MAKPGDFGHHAFVHHVNVVCRRHIGKAVGDQNERFFCVVTTKSLFLKGVAAQRVSGIGAVFRQAVFTNFDLIYTG